MSYHLLFFNTKPVNYSHEVPGINYWKGTFFLVVKIGLVQHWLIESRSGECDGCWIFGECVLIIIRPGRKM